MWLHGYGSAHFYMHRCLRAAVGHITREFNENGVKNGSRLKGVNPPVLRKIRCVCMYVCMCEYMYISFNSLHVNPNALLHFCIIEITMLIMSLCKRIIGDFMFIN